LNELTGGEMGILYYIIFILFYSISIFSGLCLPTGSHFSFHDSLSSPVFVLSLSFIFSLLLSQPHTSFSFWLFLSLPIIINFVFLPVFNFL